MQVHGDDMIDAGDREQVGEHAGGNGTAMALLLGLARVGEIPRLRVSIHCDCVQTRRVAYGMTAGGIVSA